jgi:hypothetical protein
MVAKAESGADPLGLALAPAQVLEQIALLEKQRRDLDLAIEELRATHARLSEADAAQAVFKANEAA